MALDFKYRIHEVAKDFGMTSKDISQILTDYATTPKNHMQVLEDAELDLIFEYLTQHHQVGSIAEIFAPEPEEKKAPAKAPEEKKPDAPAQEKTAGQRAGRRSSRCRSRTAAAEAEAGEARPAEAGRGKARRRYPRLRRSEPLEIRRALRQDRR